MDFRGVQGAQRLERSLKRQPQLHGLPTAAPQPANGLQPVIFGLSFQDNLFQVTQQAGVGAGKPGGGGFVQHPLNQLLQQARGPGVYLPGSGQSVSQRFDDVVLMLLQRSHHDIPPTPTLPHQEGGSQHSPILAPGHA